MQTPQAVLGGLLNHSTETMPKCYGNPGSDISTLEPILHQELEWALRHGHDEWVVAVA